MHARSCLQSQRSSQHRTDEVHEPLRAYPEPGIHTTGTGGRARLCAQALASGRAHRMLFALKAGATAFLTARQ